MCSKNNDHEDLLERARKLREQATLMEENLRAHAPRPTSSSSSFRSPTTSSPMVEYTELENSIWTISYRFSSQPPLENNDNYNKKDSNAMPFRTFYSGNFRIRLKDDGYSEYLSTESDFSSSKSDIRIVKIWGWDKETSNEDDQNYLLFSMDVKLPGSDPDLPNQTERYYFQARIDWGTPEGKSILQLREGTITVKKDVAEQTKGRWGLFNVAGILSQFRYCGDFIAKATAS